MMAFAASTVNLRRGFIGELTGVWINKTFVGVTGEDLSKFYILSYIGLGCIVYEFFVIRLIPILEEIDKEITTQKSLRET